MSDRTLLSSIIPLSVPIFIEGLLQILFGQTQFSHVQFTRFIDGGKLRGPFSDPLFQFRVENPNLLLGPYQLGLSTLIACSAC
jgi:hypothetical protein